MIGSRNLVHFSAASIAALLVAASAILAAQASQTRSAELVMMGTGTPVPDPDASSPASAVVVDGSRLFLVDAGAGATRRLAAAGFPRVNAVEAMFITHLHSDHTLAIPT